jgi:hypothetical protein
MTLILLSTLVMATPIDAAQLPTSVQEAQECKDTLQQILDALESIEAVAVAEPEKPADTAEPTPEKSTASPSLLPTSR